MTHPTPSPTNGWPTEFRIPDHELLRPIGKGAYGEVWLARSALGTLRAVKIVTRRSFEDERPYRREFDGLRRYEPLSRSHPGLMDILQVGIDDDGGWFYCVMELADDASPDGEYTPQTLKSLLVERGGRIPALEVARVGEMVAAALQFLHEAGLVHRDVKPANILFVQGVPKLGDVGLVAGQGAELSFVGTEGYVPREGPGESAADIFALGRVLYESASGLHRRSFPEYPASFDGTDESEAYAELNQILLRACAPDVAERYLSAADLRAELLLLGAGRSIRELRASQARIAWLKRLAAGLAIAGLVVTVGYLWQVRETARSRAIAEAESRIANYERANAAWMRQNLYAADLAAAQQLANAGNHGGARLLLDAYTPKGEDEPDLREFDWYWLNGQLATDPHRALPELDSIVRFCEYDDAGDLWVGTLGGDLWRWSASGVGYEKVESVHEGESIFFFRQAGETRFFGGNGGLYSSAKGKLIDRNSLFWDVSPAGSWAVGTQLWEMSDRPNPIVLTDLSGKTPERTLPDTRSWAAFSPDGALLATAGVGGRFQLWQAADGFLSPRPLDSYPTDAYCLGIAFSRDGTRIAAGLDDGRVLIWDSAIGKRVSITEGRGPGGVWQPRFSRDGSKLAVAAGQENWVIDVATGAIERRLRGHTDDVNCVDFSPDGDWLASGGKDRAMRIWKLDESPSMSEQSDTLKMRSPPVFNRDGSLLAGIVPGDSIHVWNARDGKVEATYGTEHDWPLAFSDDGDALFTTVRFWSFRKVDWRSGKVLRAIRLESPEEGNGAMVALSPNGRWLCGGTNAGTVVVWDTETGQIARRLRGHSRGVVRLEFSPDGAWLASSGYDREVWIWDVAKWQGRKLADHGHNALGLAFSPDSSLLATASWDGKARLFSVATGTLLRSIRGETSSLDGICFTPDGSVLAFARADRRVALIDTRTWRSTVTLPGEHLEAELHFLAASPDGTSIIGCSDDGRAGRIWRISRDGL